MRDYTFEQQLNAAEEIVTRIAVALTKGFVHIVFLAILGIYNLGRFVGRMYHKHMKDESLEAVKLIAAAVENHETTTESNDEVADPTDLWLQAMDEGIAAFEDRACTIGGIQNDSEYQIHHTIELPCATAFKAPYYDWKAGRCKKGYRKVGNQCVLKEYVQYVAK